MSYVIAAGLLALAGLLGLGLRAQGLQRAVQRGSYFDTVTPLFSNLIAATAPTGFPRFSGHFENTVFDLQVVPDTLTYRKLPALWLLVTLPEPMPVKATLDIMLRPMGVEPFSHFRELAQQITTPANFPADCALRCDDPSAIPPADLVAAHLARLDENKLKELVISPKGLRIVWLVEEANRSRYLAFRDAEMGKTPLQPALLEPLLHALIALRDDLKDAP